MSDNMIKKSIEKALIDAGRTKGELAKHLRMTPQTLSARLRSGKFSYNEMVEIANFLGCPLYISVMPDQIAQAKAYDTL